MAPFRGRGGRGRGGPRGGARGGARGGGKLARSGIRTRGGGYKKFDSQRVRDLDESADEQPQIEEEPSEDESEGLSDEEEIDEVAPKSKAYNQLLQSLHQPEENGERKAKRRKIEVEPPPVLDEEEIQAREVEGALAESEEDAQEAEDEQRHAGEDIDEEDDAKDPFEIHCAHPDSNELSRRLQAIQSSQWHKESRAIDRSWNLEVSSPGQDSGTSRLAAKTVADLPLKERLMKNINDKDLSLRKSHVNEEIASTVFSYRDLVFSGRTPSNAAVLRKMASLHVVNHVLKGRDKVLKNNERLSHASDDANLDVRDQGYVRPKVLILTEMRQMAAKYVDDIVKVFQPDQQENRKRFDDSFSAPLDDRENMPEDFRETHGGNNNNSFLTALKFTRKTLKLYSAFYNGDIIMASPLGLRQVIENSDAKKRDHDFLSSIEVVIVDQADAMYMQTWENVEVVFKHLNLEMKEAHGCDFSRVRNYYLDGNAKYLRQTIVFTPYLTPEMNALYNKNMQNAFGKAKITPTCEGAIIETSGLGIKQTFSRFDCKSLVDDPDARFKYFTIAILPALLRLPRPVDGAPGILIFIPSYFDFLRLRNHFAASDQTANISFGAVDEYSETSAQRRARSHFMSGRHSFLLYTQRAHHFFRLKIRGVKRVVMYGLPDNPVFYQELVEGYLGTTVHEGKIDPAEAGLRCAFSKWDGMKLERVVGSGRVKGMLSGVGDTFDFV